MHILHVTKRYPKAVGGDARAVLGLEREQHLNGHRVTVVTTNCSSINNDPHVHKFGLSISDEALDQVSLKRILSCLWGILWGLRLLASERPDVVHTHCPDLGFSLALPARLLRIPRIVTLHGTCIGNPDFPMKSRLERLLVQFGHYDRLLTVDPEALPALEGLTHEPPLFIANSVAVEEFLEWQPSTHGARLLFIGRLEAVKRVDVLLAAVAEARAHGSDATLDIVGSGHLQMKLQHYAAELGLGEHVHFFGRRSHEEVAQRLATSAGLVLPSDHEGFPMVLLEAWASGVPVIATTVGAVTQICTDGEDALLVPPKSVSALAQAIVALLKDPVLAAQIAAAGRRKVEQYSPVKVNGVIEEHYRAIIDRNHRCA